MSQLKRQHFYLIELAKQTIAKRFKEGRHHAFAALRTRSGKVFSGIQLKTEVARASVCAEASAIAVAASEGDTEIETIAVVNRYGELVPPCGLCRELILHYSPKAEVLVPGPNGGKVMTIQQLLPLRQGYNQDK